MESDRANSTAAELLVSDLVTRGVDTIFGLPGVQLDPLLDAIARAEGLRFVHCRHEQSASFMAYGYARATGRPGVCVVVPGPGVLHAGAGMAAAWANHAPVLMLAGDIFGGAKAEGLGALHEVPDQSAILTGTMEWTRRIESPDEITPVVAEAFGRLAGTPARPAALEVGPGVLGQAIDGLSLSNEAVVPVDSPPDADDVAAAREILGRAERPVIMLGGGGRESGPEILALAEMIGAPIIQSPSAKGTIDERNPIAMPPTSGFALLGQADVVLVAGSRFGRNDSGSVSLRPGTHVIRIDTNPRRARQPLNDGVHLLALISDIKLTVQALSTTELHQASDDWRRRAEALRAEMISTLTEEYPATTACCRAIRAAMPDDGIIVDEMTQVGYMARNTLPAFAPRTYITSGFQGTLGYGYPTALGVKVARPDLPVVSMAGDGGFGYNIGELATAAHHNIGVVAVVFRDNAFGNVKGIQQRTYGREIGSSLTNPDYVALAKSFGIAATRVDDLDHLETAISKAITEDAPALIEVPLGPQPNVWARLMGEKPFELPS